MTQAEKDEFLAAYQELHEPLMRFCMVKSRGIMDAKDLVNDVLLIGLENYAKLSEKKALLSYLFTSANRICLNKIRRRKFAGAYHEKDINILEDYSSDPSEKADVSFLYEALDQLPERQKEALILFEISDLPIKEIMTIQNSGESAVKQRIKRGKEKLAELLGEKEKRKIAVLIPLFITSQSFGMTHLDLYFQAFKSLPLPLSVSEASATIVQFTASGTAIHPGANKLGTTLLKKIGLGILIAAAGISTTFILMSPTETQKEVVYAVDSQGSDQKLSHFMAPIHDYDTEEPVLYPDNSSTELADNHTYSEADTLQKTNKPTFDSPPIKNEKTKKEKPGLLLAGDLFSLASISTVRFDNLGDHVEVQTWNRNDIKIIPNYIIEAKTAEDEAFIREQLAFRVEQKGDILVLTSNFCNAELTTIGFGRKGINTVQFGNGKKIKYKIIEANYTVMLPATVNLDVRGHYKTITLPDRLGNLKTDLYETKFTCGSVAGEGDLTLHYSKAEMGNFKKLKLSLFEGTANLKTADEFDLECKYSTVNAERVAGSNLQLFESKFNAQHYRGALTANLKYSSVNFSISELSASTIVAFESRINIPSFTDLTLDLRYSTLTSDVIKDLTLSVGFESKFYLGSVNSLVAESSKYCTYTISSLGGQISMDSFEDRLTITKSSLAPMNFAGKYSTYTINLSQPSNYRLKLDGNYCRLNYMAHSLKITRSEQTNEHKILEGFFGSATNDSPLISFNCFESSINLN